MKKKHNKARMRFRQILSQTLILSKYIDWPDMGSLQELCRKKSWIDNLNRWLIAAPNLLCASSRRWALKHIWPTRPCYVLRWGNWRPACSLGDWPDQNLRISTILSAEQLFPKLRHRHLMGFTNPLIVTALAELWKKNSNNNKNSPLCSTSRL